MRRGETDSKMKFLDHISCVTIPLILRTFFNRGKESRNKGEEEIMESGETYKSFDHISCVTVPLILI